MASVSLWSWTLTLMCYMNGAWLLLLRKSQTVDSQHIQIHHKIWSHRCCARDFNLFFELDCILLLSIFVSLFLVHYLLWPIVKKWWLIIYSPCKACLEMMLSVTCDRNKPHISLEQATEWAKIWWLHNFCIVNRNVKLDDSVL